MPPQAIQDASPTLEFDRWPTVPGEVTFGDVRMLSLPPGKVNINVRRAAHTINVTLNSSTVDMAFNSDRCEKRVVVSGSIGFFPKGSTFQLVCDNQLPECLIEIGDDTMQEWVAATGLNELRPFAEDNPYMFDLMSASFGRLAVQSLSGVSEDVLADELTCEAFLIALSARFVSICERLGGNGASKASSQRQRSQADRLRRSMEYALEHLSDPRLRIADMASVAGLSGCHFSEIFKKTFGVTPYTYIKEERLNYARDLVVHSSLSLGEIAYESGFSSQSHMTSSFSNYFGRTPAKLRA